MKRYYRKNYKSLLLFGIVNILAAITSVYLSFLLGDFADAALAGSAETVWRMAGITLFYICMQTLFEFLLQYTRDFSVQKIGKNIRMDLVEKIEALPYEKKCLHDNGWYTALVYNDTSTVELEYLDSLGAIFFQICCFILALAFSFSIQPTMTAIILAISVLPVAFPKLTEKKLQSAKEDSQSAKAVYLSSIDQILSGFSTLKIFNRFAYINKRHEHQNEELCEKEIKFSKLQSLLYAGAYGCGNLVFLGTWVVGLFFVTKHLITLPLLITFSQLMTFVAGPVQIISERYSLTVAASAVCKRLLEFLDAPIDDEISWGNQHLGGIEEAALKNVCYSAGESMLLDNVNLTMHKGDRIALIGKSGSGKSTLLKTISALYEGNGTYQINGQPYRSFSYEDFRKQVTLLEQKTFIFDGSVWDNVSLFHGGENPERNHFLELLKSANLIDWYQGRGGMPDVQIGEEKEALSGGEERRLDLARVLYQRSGLVLMDEPTTGLDEQAKRCVEDAIKDLSCDILVVATHDTSPAFLNSFNRVIVMENGKLAEATRSN